MKKYFSLILMLLLSIAIKASRIDGKQVSFNDLFEVMIHDDSDPFSAASVGSPVAFYSQNGFVIIRGAKVEFDRIKDNPWDSRFSKGANKKIVIKKGIDFIDCEFSMSYWFVLRDFVFEGPISFRRCKNVHLFFRNCEFKSNFTIRGGEMQFAEFENCTFRLGFDMSENATVTDHITFKKCLLTYDEDFYNHPKVNPSQSAIDNLLKKPKFFDIENRSNPFSLRMIDCELKIPPKSNLIFSLRNATFNNLELVRLISNTILDLSFAIVGNQLNLKGLKTSNLFLAEALSFNPANSRLDWSQVAGYKIAIKTDKEVFISGKYLQNIQEDYDFNALISVYALLYSSYKAQGNRLDANYCYVEWKNIETAFLKKKLNQNNDFSLYFSWLMNTFLQMFCDYGTNPIKAMVWSGYVILFFSLVYFFFPNTNNLPDEYNYYNRIQAFTKYFVENKKLSECIFIHETPKSAFALQRQIRRNRDIVPRFIRFFALPAYQMRRWEYLKIKWIRRIDTYAGRWNEISERKKKFVKLIYLGILLSSFLYMGFIKSLNALMLSVNVFSTLGFGNIPVEGVAKYLTVIEGFIGWFLLSIFSVALISQIIQ